MRDIGGTNGRDNKKDASPETAASRAKNQQSVIGN